MKELVKKLLEPVFGQVEILIPKSKGHGDYAVFIGKQEIPESLSDLTWLSYDLVNGYLNLTVSDDLLPIDIRPQKKHSLDLRRLKAVVNRLKTEGYTHTGQKVEHFLSLVKLLNLVNIYMREYEIDDLSTVLNLFHKLDLGYHYRRLSHAELSYVYHVYAYAKEILEEVTDE